MAYRDIDLQVRCNYCSASIGQRCRRSPLMRPVKTISSPHKVRVRKADQSSDNQGRAGTTATGIRPRVVDETSTGPF